MAYDRLGMPTAAHAPDAGGPGERRLTIEYVTARALLDAMPQAVWAARPDGTQPWCNAAWAALMEGATPSRADASFLDTVHPDESEAVRTGDDKTFMRIDREFNELCLAAVKNEFAAGAMGLMNSLSRRFWFHHYKQAADMPETAKLHADIAHPINSACREVIQGAVIRAYQEEKERSKQPGYVCRYDDYDGDYDDSFSQVVGQMNGAANGEMVRSHAAHGHQRGTHANLGQEARAGQQREAFNEFETCIGAAFVHGVVLLAMATLARPSRLPARQLRPNSL